MKKYVTLDTLLKEDDARFKMIIGGRSNGKSFAVKNFCLSNAIDDSGKFGYLRRYSDDIKPRPVERYFWDYDIQSLTEFEADTITVFNGGIYLSSIMDDGKIKRKKEVGNTFWLGGAEHYKSMQFPDITDLIFEEFLTISGYCYNEPANLMSIVSTIFREREGRVWLIGNTDTKLNPLIDEWGLTRKISRQKIGSTEVYNISDGQKVVVYRTGEVAESKMTFRKKDSVDKGEWDVDNYPNMVYNKEEYSLIYNIAYESIFNFTIWYCIFNKTGIPFLFITPRTRSTRCYATVNVKDGYMHEGFFRYSSFLQFEVGLLINKLLKEGRVVYSSNECGTDFNQCLALDNIIS